MVVLFDFDQTLTKWDTADRFFKWLLKREAWRMAAIVVSLPFVGPLLIFQKTRKWPLRYGIWLATLGRSSEDIRLLANEHVETLFQGDASPFYSDALANLQDHINKGDQVVIATGCLTDLASSFLRKAGLDSVPLVASTMRPYFGGMVRDKHCFSHNKIPMLSERGFPPPWAVTYTDHYCDIPVLLAAQSRFVVNPTEKSLKRIQGAIGNDFTVLNWE